MFRPSRLIIDVSPLFIETIETLRFYFDRTELRYELDLLETVVDAYVISRLKQRPMTVEFLHRHLADMLAEHYGLDNALAYPERADVMLMHRCNDMAASLASNRKLREYTEALIPVVPTGAWNLTSPVMSIYCVELLPPI